MFHLQILSLHTRHSLIPFILSLLFLPYLLQAAAYMRTQLSTYRNSDHHAIFAKLHSGISEVLLQSTCFCLLYAVCDVVIESGNIQSSEFAVTHLPSSTVASQTQLVIAFQLYKAPLAAGEYLTLSVLVTDEAGLKFNVGIVELQISTSTLTFSGFDLSYANSKVEVYPLALPMNFTRSSSAANNRAVLTFIATPPTYFVQGKIFFSYIYITNAYSALHPVSIFPLIN